MANYSWLVPLAFSVLVAAFVIWRVRVWTGQGDGLAALILWAQGLMLIVIGWVGWWAGQN